MRLWNLSEFNDLTQVVVDEIPKITRVRQRAMRRPSSTQERFKVLGGVASIVISLSIGNAIVNQSVVRLPNWSAAVVQSVPNVKPPLEDMFAGRFSADWTETKETALLGKVVDNLLTKNAAIVKDSIVSFVHSNQQESIALQSPRLSLATVEQIVRKRKTS
jgi:hypothetical protein